MTQTTGKTTRADPLQAERETFAVASTDTMNAPKRPRRIVSASQRRAEIVIATLFLVSAVTSFLGMSVLNPILNASDYLARVFPHKGAVELGSLLWSINSLSSSRCLRLACSENAMKCSRSGTWLPASSRASS